MNTLDTGNKRELDAHISASQPNLVDVANYSAMRQFRLHEHHKKINMITKQNLRQRQFLHWEPDAQNVF